MADAIMPSGTPFLFARQALHQCHAPRGLRSGTPFIGALRTMRSLTHSEPIAHSPGWYGHIQMQVAISRVAVADGEHVPLTR